MRHLATVLALSLLPLTAAGAAPRSGADGDLEPLVQDQLAAASALPVAELWERAQGLRELAGADGDAGLDVLLDRYLAQAGAVSEPGLLLLAACRFRGQDVDGGLLAGALSGLLDSENPEVATAAAELLANQGLKAALSKESRAELVQTLLASCEDALSAPELRLATARAAYALGGGTEKAEARRQMHAFLGSTEPHLRALGALSLGAIAEPITGDFERELKRLADLPGERGDLAASYLKQEDIKRLKEDRYRRLDRLYDKKLPSEELSAVNSVLRMVQDMHLDGDKYSRQELTDAALDGMLHALDEHSSYLSSEVFTKFNQELGGEYGGIGAYVGIDPDDGLFTITRPIYSGPAYRAGLVTDDKIVRIDDWPTHDHRLSRPTDDIIEHLKGRPDTTVRLYVWQRGMDPDLIDRPTEDMVVEIVRAEIQIPYVQSEMLPGKLGMVSLSSFSRIASQELQAALEELLADGMRGLVFDLRNNQGGYLNEAANVADLFLPAGKRVVSTEGRHGTTQVLETRRPALLPADMPMVVLINRWSASAAEIVSGALQDHERATLVGERSFGKGSVQDLLVLDGQQDDVFRDENGNRRFDNWEELEFDQNGNGQFDFAPRVKLTIAEYLLPSGRSIHRKLDADRNVIQPGGVMPDVEVRLPRIDAWRYEEQYRIRVTERLTRTYIEEHWDAHAELLTELARNDAKDCTRYPDFEAFYAAAKTPLPKDDVRRLLRAEARRRVQDVRGREFPLADVEEDIQAQAAVTHVLSGLGIEPASIHEYLLTFASLNPTPEDVRPALARAAEEELAQTLKRLQAARAGEVELSTEDLDRLIELLAESKEN